jgi:Recombinase zinc beta ribbon domain
LQAALKQAAKSPYVTKHTYPLSGVLIAPCGMAYSGQFTNDRRYYRCRGREHEPRCSCRMLWSGKVEELAWGHLMDALSDPDALFARLQGQYAPIDLEEPESALASHDAEVRRLEDALTATAVRFAHLPLS